jgi:hypothetical protein
MQQNTVDIRGLDRAAVLAALYNAAHPQGMGFLQYDPEPMTIEQARELLSNGGQWKHFDYLYGRVLKVDLSEGDDQLNVGLYDRYNGAGAAQLVIDELRRNDDTNAGLIRSIHISGTQRAAEEARLNLDTPTGPVQGAGISTYQLGLSDVAEHLEPKLKKYLPEDE